MRKIQPKAAPPATSAQTRRQRERFVQGGGMLQGYAPDLVIRIGYISIAVGVVCLLVIAALLIFLPRIYGLPVAIAASIAWVLPIALLASFVFADARYSATAARLMMPATVNVRRDWNAYRARFVEPVRLGSGFRFWDDNAALLERAQRDYGVPPEIVVGILGVETVYGRNTGSFRVIDALTTLAFDYPNKARDRSTFFREQLTDALILTRNDASDVNGGAGAAAVLRGSYAGAIGMPQFMPGSILRYAVDYDGDGRIDLVGSSADIIGSVANFLAQHGWVRDLATHVPLVRARAVDPLQSASIEAMVSAGSVPSYAYADLVAAGFVAAPAGTPPDAPLALIDLPSGSDASGNAIVGYLAGTQNFHVITRYNRSYFYAFSVIELGSTIKTLRQARQ